MTKKRRDRRGNRISRNCMRVSVSLPEDLRKSLHAYARLRHFGNVSAAAVWLMREGLRSFEKERM